jgi:hypothetical protein
MPGFIPFSIKSMFVFAIWGMTPLFAHSSELSESPESMNRSPGSEVQGTQSLAQTESRGGRVKIRKRPRRMVANRKGEDLVASGSEIKAPANGVKLGGGLVFGADGASPFLLGADYFYPLQVIRNLGFVAGASFWTYSVLGFSVNFITFEGGVDYHFPISHSGNLVGGARLTYVNASGDSSSSSKFGLTVLGGYEHSLGDSAVGGEFRIPMIADFDVRYLFGYYKVYF